MDDYRVSQENPGRVLIGADQIEEDQTREKVVMDKMGRWMARRMGGWTEKWTDTHTHTGT